MKLSVRETTTGEIFTIETGEALDLRSCSVFLRACKLAEQSDPSVVEVNLGNTRVIRDSGLAMLLMLRDRIDRTGGCVKLLNCRPEIQTRLAGRPISAGFQVG